MEYQDAYKRSECAERILVSRLRVELGEIELRSGGHAERLKAGAERSLTPDRQRACSSTIARTSASRR
jgi:hypothetical protein